MENPFPWRIALAAYLAALALVGFWPTPVDKPILGTLSTALEYLHRLGVPDWYNYHFVEASGNVAMFIPLGFLAAKALPAIPSWHLAAIGFLASSGMECGQLLFLSARFSSVTDIVTNMCGAVIGIASAHLLTQITAGKLAET